MECGVFCGPVSFVWFVRSVTLHKKLAYFLVLTADVNFNFRFSDTLKFGFIFEKKYIEHLKEFFLLETGHETLTQSIKNNGQRGSGFCELSIERVSQQGAAVRRW